MAISVKAIDRLSDGRINDSVTAGLSIEVSRRGKVWRYRRRVAGGAGVVNVMLGCYPAYSIKDARQWAAGLNSSAEAGIDPREAERAQRAASRTLADGWSLYLADITRGERKVLKPRTLSDKRKIWSCDIEPYLGSMLLADITADDLWELVETKGEVSQVRANRLAAELKVIFGWFLSRAGQKAGVRLAVDPALSLNGKHYIESKGRTRALSDDELGWFMSALAPEPLRVRRAFLLMLLSGCRISEVIQSQPEEYRDGVWTIPASRTKNSTAHVVRLAAWGRELLSSRTTAIDYDSCRRGRDRIYKRMTASRTVEHWTAHDLRRTFRSNTFGLDIRFEVAERMLNHSKQGLERRYDVADLSAHMEAGWKAWEDKLASIARAAGVARELGLKV